MGFAALLALALPVQAAGSSAPGFDWAPWRALPVLDAGRPKPFDTLARETLASLSGRGSFPDPTTGRKLDPVELYLTMLFEWQGWDRAADPHAAAGAGTHVDYFAAHQPDKWDRARLLRVDHPGLRKALGMAAGQRHISPLELTQAEIHDPLTGRKTSFLSWAARLFRSGREAATPLERKGMELADKFLSYEAHRMGTRLFLLPIQGSEHHEWTSASAILRSSFDDRTDPTGALRKAKQQLAAVRSACASGDEEAFGRATAELLATLREAGPALGNYPAENTISLELAYNRWMPFRLAWMLTLVGFAGLVAGPRPRWQALSLVGLAAIGLSVAAMLAGFALRMAISGRAPVTNFYESVVFTAFGAVVFGLVFGLGSTGFQPVVAVQPVQPAPQARRPGYGLGSWRRQYVVAAAAAVATVALLLADFCPSVLDPSIRPLQPVLRSNFWLAVHVITIMLSYAAFALAMAIGNLTLGYYLAGSRREDAIAARARLIYKTLQAGVLLLVVGTILGAAWADYSWGRFWGWDPKEVWALISLLCYLALLHARSAGGVGNLGLAAWSVVCFVLVIMAWYGVNLLRTGMHNYGFGGDGAEYYVLGAVLLQLLYVAAAVLRHAASFLPATPRAPARTA